MRRVVLFEHSTLVPWTGRPDAIPKPADRRVHVEEGLYHRLQRFDARLGRDGGQVFHWFEGSARARQWVGVVEVPGLQVEILPKIDRGVPEVGAEEAAEPWREARGNLLYMLALAGDVPVRSRDVARLATRTAPLHETLAALFGQTLVQEMLRGVERCYMGQEENLRTLRGRVVVNQHVVKNAAHRERFYCRYDEFSEDTRLNRVFKAACRFLLKLTQSPGTQDALRRCLLVLDEVTDEVPREDSFRKVRFNRQNERFADLFEFARLILSGESPSAAAGASRSFSLLFDMNRVFERFVAAFVASRVMPDLPDCRLFPQARHNRRPLFGSDGSRDVLYLTPDLLVRYGSPAAGHLVIDTKWKRPPSDVRDARERVADSDLYQLFAYTHRFGCARSILLYPKVSGATPRDFHVLDEQGGRCGRTVSVRFVNLNRDLYIEVERSALAAELRKIVEEGVGRALSPDRFHAAPSGGAA